MDGKTSDWRPGPSVCRCCLAEGCYKDISTEYFWMGKREVYADMLSDTFSVSIAYSSAGGPNSHSRLICEPCISRLRDAADFKRQVQECERTFMQHLDPGSTSAANDIDIEAQPAGKEVKLEQVKLEKRFSDDDFDTADFGDEDDDDMDDQPLTKFATKVPKKEAVDFLDLIDNSQITVKRMSMSKSKAPPAKKVKVTKKEPAKPTASKAPIKVVKEKKKKGLIQETNSTLILKDDDGNDIKLKLLKEPISLDDLECIYEDNDTNCKKEYKNMKFKKVKRNANMAFLKKPIALDKIDWGADNEPITFHVKTIQGPCLREVTRKKTKTDQTWKENALTIFENSFVYPFIHANNKYKCFICSKEFLEAPLLKEHSLTHNINEIREELNNRVRDKNIKVDVTYTQCKICSESLSDLKSLKIHLKDHGKKLDAESHGNLIPFKLGGNSFECQVCGESYLKLRLLIIHMSKHFNNYSCEICGSVFISLTLLKRHLQTHETGSFPCDKCDKVFSNSAKRTLHMRGVHLKKFPRRCPICPERFNSNYQRTKHLRIVHNQTTGLFRCETCGREYDLKYHLLVHIRSVHLQERNQECPICHSRFFSKYCLSRHMVIHTGEKNFKCDVCGKAYTRRKNLREHSRTHAGHACSICGQNFLDQTSLMSHVTAHAVL
ncbi:zinc finger protein 624 isoform X3 [Manduca sexta]|uniref:zinc finger protein 624 isoform X3 n=1 Tax=Manduca sexta TaxID=7130 RepID=UPI00189022D2|nr:zinc finger protein 624 isoform X3 [Manduca sexta]